MTTKSLGISVPIPGKKTIFTVKKYFLGGFHAACSVARFRFRYRDLEFHSFGSETDSETPFSLKSVPSPIPRRDLDRESRCFGSETREPGISAWNHLGPLGTLPLSLGIHKKLTHQGCVNSLVQG